MDEMLGVQTRLRKRFIFSFEKKNVMQTLQRVRHKCENIHLQVQFQRDEPTGATVFAQHTMAPYLAVLWPQ